MLHDAGTTVNKNPLIIYRISQTTAVNNSLQCALVTDEHNFNKYLEEFLSLLILNERIRHIFTRDPKRGVCQQITMKLEFIIMH